MRRLLPIALAAALLAPAGRLQAQPLPGTEAWEHPGNPSADMVAGIARFLDRTLAASVRDRQAKWHRDTRSPEAYAASVEPKRARFRRIIGAVGERVSPVEVELIATTDTPVTVAETDRYTIRAVRWGVYPGVWAEGLMLEPKGEVRARVVAMADCDATPEQLAGVAPGLPPTAQVARLLVEAGCLVLVPTLIDRSDEFSGNPAVRMTNLPHREWIYRMAYETGRHVIGYEVDKVRAAVDWFARDGQADRPIGVVGHGEGGLIALYAAAVDPRIDATWVAGYVAPREQVWREPIYRNVWGLLEEFGDAEILGLIAPRVHIVEACRGPEIAGPPPPRNGRNDAASGRLTTPDPVAVKSEVFRHVEQMGSLVPENSSLFVSIGGEQPTFNQDDRVRPTFLRALGIDSAPEPGPTPPEDRRSGFDPRARMKRQVGELVDYTQAILRTSELRRAAYWSKADKSSPESWAASIEPYRAAFAEELIGQFPPASEPLRVRTYRIYDEPKWVGYGVELPVWPDVVASGVLLLPKDLKPGERRPVVVCQHGLEGTPEPVVDPRVKSVYNNFGARLADLGYIVYAPQNPYIGHDAFRLLQRRANPLKRSLFSVIARQHERTLEWLSTLPQVDRERIAFYGLSYGGKTAMRVPALLKGYCLSICSADFNEWVVKCTDVDRAYSYLFTLEYDMYEFGLAEGFNYAEMAALIAPRPFLVERGHHDGVAPDEWVNYEFAKVRRLYSDLGIADRTAIAHFDGPHMIHGVEAFAFLNRHLGGPFPE